MQLPSQAAAQVQPSSADLLPSRALPWARRDASESSFGVRSRGLSNGGNAGNGAVWHRARASDPDFEGACRHTLQDMELVEPGVAKEGTCVA
jgi:hypothetical protein